MHGAYYLFLHFWVRVAGTSEFATRLPSAVAAGIAVAGVVTLARLLFGVRTGVLAGAVIIALPEVTRVAIEARSYAFSMAIATWITVLLVTLVRRGEAGRRWWLLYAAGLALGVYVFLYLSLLIPVHLAVVVLLASERRRMLGRWAQATAIGLVLATPVVVAGVTQEHQIAFLASRDYASANAVLVHQWFHSVPLAVVAWALIVSGAAGTVLRRTHVTAAAAVLIWLVLPTAALLAGDTWISPMYNFRYTGFCLPAVALAMAIGLVQIGDLVRQRPRRIVTQAVAVAVVVAMALPVFTAQRREFAKDGGSDLRQTAEAVAQLAVPGDAVVFDQTVKPSRRPRLARHLLHCEQSRFVRPFTGGRRDGWTDHDDIDVLRLPRLVRDEAAVDAKPRIWEDRPHKLGVNR
ncbi:MAG: glycosyltransferase family 39 protein [Microbacteriaceae bacterium]